MYIKGYVKKSKKTKVLVSMLNEDIIPVICHEDIDEVAANSLIEKRIKAVINCCKSISGRYPSKGANILIENEVLVIDDIGMEFYNIIKDEDIIEIKDFSIFINEHKYDKQITILDKNKIQRYLDTAKKNFSSELHKFIENTLEYAYKEKDIVIKSGNIPKLQTKIKDKHVLIVVRGCNYKEDLNTIMDYIKDFKPVLIGVDGGGDALIECGFAPDIIVGDMDSVSDKCLKKCKEIIVHAYKDGNAPGMERIKQLNLNAHVFPFPGTSEDIAMIIAYEKKAELIVAVGTHSNMVDFLEKGRKGMASTLLTRLKVGTKLVDAKGVSKLYSNKLKLSYLVPILLAALIPVFAIARIYIPLKVILDIFEFKFNLK